MIFDRAKRRGICFCEKKTRSRFLASTCTIRCRASLGMTGKTRLSLRIPLENIYLDKHPTMSLKTKEGRKKPPGKSHYIILKKDLNNSRSSIRLLKEGPLQRVMMIPQARRKHLPYLIMKTEEKQIPRVALQKLI